MAGSEADACATRFWTSTAAMLRGYPTSNVTVIVEEPSLELEDDMYVIPCTPLICCSSGVVTVSATTWALAPGYAALTTTWGGVMSGNCETGSRKYQMAPV